ncbi:16S rRNA processing protein RimM [Hasllibacter halocynthiae]|uniref:Ribosome maturation factor RimM n=1 Tax=Hasllibacter halocynthiae TaxID=595589 RepID=A0A2T0X3P3_9RHOB|nr:ribosome maturation factor RimM [Hasllibacter halocynthiae]PRY93537.1 16S rRNA processing protein RimM [Hasllibacter halocynthiae]
MPEDRVTVAAVAGAFGVRGEVRLKSFTADPAAVGDYGPLMGPDGTEYPVRAARAVKGGFAVRLGGVDTRVAAEALRGTRLTVPRAALPDPGEDEFYQADLLGLAVLDPGGAVLGRVKAVLSHGEQDLLEIHRPAKEGGGTALVPFTREIVPTVDLSGGRIVVDPPDGLLD